ncbi:peptide-methionine (R)-S-oxide reductase MsrB [Chelativorans sp. Marseille-P2723]|uniref:peptide-methionine (R)-S-oxide reductase MsrB n=1 Tax=Chelativorans sp. Marseille-P2723 TaxID=2709133 RepID=UPI001570C16A|nr:peptide-methionine (R)-S-oxide reductase MsrB [Chelativorans sp. Marseille-P2723]
MKRRNFLYGGAGAFAALAGSGFFMRNSPGGGATAATFEIMKPDEEWRAILSPEQYAVLRQEVTEPAYSSPLNGEKRAGIFHCAGCDLPLYSSEAKYDSGTGWPSFWESLSGAIGTKKDRSFFMVRTECHCRRCGGHLGHIFDDGPLPTGKRHCINGLALTFNAAEAT